MPAPYRLNRNEKAPYQMPEGCFGKDREPEAGKSFPVIFAATMFGGGIESSNAALEKDRKGPLPGPE